MKAPGGTTLTPDWSLYLVTDPSYMPSEQLAQHVLQAVEGGVSVVQLRDKQAPDQELEHQARALLGVLGDKVPLFINDRVALAQKLGLHLHIGQTDMPYVQARQLLPAQQMIGLSIENLEQLEDCIRQCAAARVRLPDVVGLGPLEDTPTKPDAAPALGVFGIAQLAQRAAREGIPSVAIGGIQAKNAADVAAAGVNGICVVSALMGSETPTSTARLLRCLFEGGQS